MAGAIVLVTLTCWYSSLHLIFRSSVQIPNIVYLRFIPYVRGLSCKRYCLMTAQDQLNKYYDHHVNDLASLVSECQKE